MSFPRTVGRIARWLLAIVLGLVALVALTLLVLVLPPGENLIRNVAADKLSSALKQPVSIGRLRTDLFTSLKLRDVALYENASDTTPIASMARLEVSYRLIPLLHKRLAIGSVLIDSLKLNLDRDSSGAFNLAILNVTQPETAKVKTKAGLTFEFKEAVVRHADLAYRDQVEPRKSGRLLGLNASASGKEGHYAVTLKADSGAAAYRDVAMPLAGLGLDLNIGPGSYGFSRLQLKLPGVDLSGAVAMQRDTLRDPPDSVDYDLKGNLRIRGEPAPVLELARSLLPPNLYPVSGSMDLNLNLNGTTQKPVVGVDLFLQETQISDLYLKQGLIQGTWQRDFMQLDSLELDLLGGHLSAQGEFSPDSLHYQLAAALSGIESDQIWKMLHQKPPPYKGVAAGRMNASGYLKRPTSWEATADLRLQHVRYLTYGLSDMKLKLELHRGLATMDLAQNNAYLQARGRFDNHNLEGQFAADIFQVQPLAGLAGIADVSGQAQIRGTVSGNLNSPNFQASLQAVNLLYRNFPVDSLTGTVVYTNRRLFLSDVAFKGALNPVDTLSPPFGVSGLQGRIDYQGSAQGPVDSLAASVMIYLRDFQFSTLQFNEGSALARFEGKQLSLTALNLRRETVLVQATAGFDLAERAGSMNLVLSEQSPKFKLKENESVQDMEADSNQVIMATSGKIAASFATNTRGGISAEIKGRNLKTEQVLALISKTPVKIALDKTAIRGNTSFDLVASGTMNQPAVQLQFGMKDIHLKSLTIDSADGSATFDDGALTLDQFKIHRQDFDTQGQAQVNLTKQGPMHYTFTGNNTTKGNLHGDNVDVQLIQTFLPPGMKAQGRISYQLSWDGNGNNPHTRGRIVLQQGQVQMRGNTPPINNIFLQADLMDFLLKIDELSGVMQNTPFQLAGTIDANSRKSLSLDLDLAVSNLGALSLKGLAAADTLQLKADMEHMDLALLQPLLPSVQNLGGTMTTTLTISGHPKEPHLNGHLEAHNLTFKPAGMKDPFIGGVIAADFSQERMTLDSLFFRQKKNGVMMVRGQLGYQNGQFFGVNLTTVAANLAFDKPGVFAIQLDSARIAYQSQGDLLDLGGDVYLGQSRITANFNAASFLPITRKVERPAAAPSPYMTATRLHLRLHGGDNVVVDNNVANLTLSPELSFIGTASSPNLTGHVGVVKGSVTFLDRKFDVKQGTVDFTNPTRINPILDINAQTTIRQYQGLQASSYQINLSVSGPMDTLIINLTSDPPLDRPDIISLLTLGATREQLTGVDTTGAPSTQQILVTRAQTLSTYVLSGVLSRSLGSKLGLESLSLQGNIFQTGGPSATGPTLEATKQVSERLLVTYTTNVGHFNENGIKVDYLLNKFLSLQGQTDQSGQSGIDVKYSVQFK